MTLVGVISTAQAGTFDPNKLEGEYFKNDKIKHGAEFVADDGQTYKITKRDRQVGLRICKRRPNGRCQWLRHGLHTRFYSNGRVYQTDVYEWGKRNGPHREWTKKSKMKFEYYYKNGRQHGPYRHWRDNGKLATEKQYENGRPVKVVDYCSDGQSVNFDKDYQNGKCVMRRHYQCGGRNHGKLLRTDNCFGKQL